MISYSCGKFDILREEELKNLDRLIQESKENGSKSFGVGIYDNNVCESIGAGIPLKSLEDRMEIMKNIIGVDFVFPVHTLEPKILEETVKKYFDKYIEEKKKSMQLPKPKKQYSTVYSPGTYDLFHAGHLENLTIASQNGEKLIVGIKADSLVQAHKNKTPIISQEERMEIMRHFKFVNDVYIYYTRDLHVAKDWIESKYGKLDAVFLGSDLKKDFKSFNDINIVFTDRPPELMKERSTSSYARKLKRCTSGEHKYQVLRGNVFRCVSSKGKREKRKNRNDKTFYRKSEEER